MRRGSIASLPAAMSELLSTTPRSNPSLQRSGSRFRLVSGEVEDMLGEEGEQIAECSPLQPLMG